MSYLDIIGRNDANPEHLEQIYHQAQAAGASDAFAGAIAAAHADQPDNLLYAAWHYRLTYTDGKVQDRLLPWGRLIPLALLNGLLFWLLSDTERFMLSAADKELFPLLVILWAPISALFVLLYLAWAGGGRWKRAAAVAVGLAALSAYALLTAPVSGLPIFQEQYLNLMLTHAPLMAWIGVGLFLLYGHRDAGNRFAFLIKSLEVLIMAGLFAIAGAAFVAITVGLFATLEIDLPQQVMHLLLAGGGGLLPVLAVGVIYDVLLEPKRQAFDQGLSHLISLLMRLLLPLSLLVMVIFLAFVPFNFWAPFRNRDVLLVYNAMLFAVMILLVGATPLPGREHGQDQQWLRRGLVALAALTLVAGLYALMAIGYRSWQGILTPNRLTFIGWNLINIGILSLLLIRQVRSRGAHWAPQLHRAFAAGMAAYVAWTLMVILTVPWLFGYGQSKLADVPVQIQPYVVEGNFPVLLKCYDSPHIYLLANGEKRWVKDIATFEAEGFVWNDVEFLPCPTLRTLPDGPPIPRDASDPPVP